MQTTARRMIQIQPKGIQWASPRPPGPIGDVLRVCNGAAFTEIYVGAVLSHCAGRWDPELTTAPLGNRAESFPPRSQDWRTNLNLNLSAEVFPSRALVRSFSRLGCGGCLAAVESGPRLLRGVVSTLWVQMFLGPIPYCYKYYNAFITMELGRFF